MKRRSVIRTGILGISTAVLCAGLTANAQTAAPAADWAGKLTFGGDARLRLAQMDNAGASNFAEFMRARLTTLGRVNDSLTANFRLATFAAAGTNAATNANTGADVMGANPVSEGDQPFGDYDSRKPISIEVASLDYKILDSLTLTGGKAVNPFFKAGGNEMIFDTDVTLEGFNLRWVGDYGMFKPFATVQQAQIVDHVVAADTTLVAGQIGSGFSFGNFGGTLALANYNYNNVKGEQAGYVAGNSYNAGTNSAGAADRIYAHEYRLTAVDLEIGMDVANIPLMLFGTYVTNSDVGDSGILGGVRAGKIAGAKTWMAEYSYRDQQADSVLGVFTDSEFANGQSNVRGHKISLAYGAMTNTTVAANVYLASRYNAISQGYQPYNRYQLDATVSF